MFIQLNLAFWLKLHEMVQNFILSKMEWEGYWFLFAYWYNKFRPFQLEWNRINNYAHKSHRLVNFILFLAFPLCINVLGI